jgi:hypothetical protein
VHPVSIHQRNLYLCKLSLHCRDLLLLLLNLAVFHSKGPARQLRYLSAEIWPSYRRMRWRVLGVAAGLPRSPPMSGPLGLAR